jgi:methionyl-tRNA formyltransferase
LLLAAVEQLKRGSLDRRPQPSAGASYLPWPGAQDFVIPTGWPARRAYNFARGAADWPLVIDTEGSPARIRVAISYADDQILDQPYVLLGDELWVQFEPGVLRIRTYS